MPSVARIINLTPHDPLVIVGTDNRQIALARQGPTVRVAEEQHRVDLLACEGVSIPVYEQRYGRSQDLPDPCVGVWLVVSQLVVVAHPERADLVFPVNLIRDAAGSITGCAGLAVRASDPAGPGASR